MSEIVLAIDPSICKCGFALVRGGPSRSAPLVRIESGVWSPSQAKAAPDRFDQLADFIAERVRANAVKTCLVEVPDGGERFVRKGGKRIKLGGKSERTYAQAVGAIRAAARAAGANVIPVTVNQWKGRGKKIDTLTLVKAIYRYQPVDDNESDALGMAEWYLNRRR